MSNLLISLPNSTQIDAYVESSHGETKFDFVSFDESEHFSGNFSSTSISDLELIPLSEADRQVAVNQEAYMEMLQDTIHHIQERQLGKIVVSRCKDVVQQLPVIPTFKKLVQAYPDACVYLFNHAKHGTWMGATPELLLSGDQDQIASMSLAGTVTTDYDQSFHEKERTEQSMVTGFIANAFDCTQGVGNIRIAKPKARYAGKLIHLQSTIKAEVNEKFSPRELLRILHPTPAVAGLPRDAALKFLAKTETYPREFYTGYFGISRPKKYSYFVNLRCMQIFKDRIRLYAGGGITADSNPKAEWEETENKMRTISNILD